MSFSPGAGISDEIAYQSNAAGDGVGRRSNTGCSAGLPGRTGRGPRVIRSLACRRARLKLSSSDPSSDLRIELFLARSPGGERAGRWPRHGSTAAHGLSWRVSPVERRCWCNRPLTPLRPAGQVAPRARRPGASSQSGVAAMIVSGDDRIVAEAGACYDIVLGTNVTESDTITADRSDRSNPGVPP